MINTQGDYDPPIAKTEGRASKRYIIFAPAVGFALLIFGPQSAKAYKAPWCAVISDAIGTASIARSKNVGRMYWQATVAGAIRARTSSPGPQKTGASANVAVTLSREP